jgi:hypothetical protein
MDLNLGGMDLNLMFKRIMRAALLDREFYKEAEADTSLNQEALIIVVIVSVASAIGSFIVGLFAGRPGAAFLALIVNAAIGVGNYYLWAYVTHYIGTNLFDGDADPGELLRVLGYASGPRLLGLLIFIPCIGPVIALAGAIWSLVTGFYGVREALDLETLETLITVFLGWLAVLLITSLVNRIFGFGNARQALQSLRF